MFWACSREHEAIWMCWLAFGKLTMQGCQTEAYNSFWGQGLVRQHPALRPLLHLACAYSSGSSSHARCMAKTAISEITCR